MKVHELFEEAKKVTLGETIDYIQKTIGKYITGIEKHYPSYEICVKLNGKSTNNFKSPKDGRISLIVHDNLDLHSLHTDPKKLKGPIKDPMNLEVYAIELTARKNLLETRDYLYKESGWFVHDMMTVRHAVYALLPYLE